MDLFIKMTHLAIAVVSTVYFSSGRILEAIYVVFLAMFLVVWNHTFNKD